MVFLARQEHHNQSQCRRNNLVVVVVGQPTSNSPQIEFIHTHQKIRNNPLSHQVACYKQVGHGKSIKQKKYHMPKLGYGDEIHVQKNLNIISALKSIKQQLISNTFCSRPVPANLCRMEIN